MTLPLSIAALIRHADAYHGDTEIVSREPWGEIHRSTYRDAHRRARQLAGALRTLGTGSDTRVGTLAWNTHRHFELYYAVASSGAILNTINPRLFPEQIQYIVNHAGNEILFFDIGFASLVQELAPNCPGVRHWIALCDRARLPALPFPVLCYEDLIAAQPDAFPWPELDEGAACVLCYTSGTTGHPKGVLYSQRSTVLRAFAVCLPDAMNLSAQDTILPVVPMFHVNAWGLPYAAALVGAKLVLPGAQLDGPSLHAMIEREGVNFSAGVPTVWMGLLAHLQATGASLSSLRRAVVGGAACPPALMRQLADYGVEVLHAWGMTELSPLGALNRPKAKHLDWPAPEREALRLKQGRPVFGVEMKIVDDRDREMPRDGRTCGELTVRGHWVASGYYKGEGGGVLRDGWFPTGDIATLDADGYLQITDRAKDAIKSGGEWISSIALEGLAMEHPAVAEAAVIGIAHPKWDERPLMVAACKPDQALSRDELLDFLRDKVAKWWLPDDILFLDRLPHTATGKLSKLALRQQLADYRWPDA